VSLAPQRENTMRHALMIAAALGLLAVSGAPASAQKIDANGRCHAANGQFAKAEVCKGGGLLKGVGGMMAGHHYKADAKGNCHDEKGKMSKKALCKS
jgi:hypothetical protein